MSAALDRIIAQVRALSPDEQRQLRELLEREARAADQDERNRSAASIRGKYRDALRPNIELLRRLQSKYAHLTTSSEAFAARKAEEIELEDRRR